MTILENPYDIAPTGAPGSGAEIDYSQGVPSPALGEMAAPGLMSPDQESIFNNVLLLTTSLMTMGFLLHAVPKEKNDTWQVFGWFGITGAFYGSIRGAAGILYHFSKKE